MTPVSVFMTFQCEEGVNRALSYSEAIEADDSLSHLRTWLGDHLLDIKKASEPSDIIWENRHFTEADKLRQKLTNVILICLILAASFSVVYLCASYSLQSLYTFPEANCKSLPLKDSPDLMRDAAIREWT
mmetsp:Transcript_41367/g.54398  ORF Transcript_41367/g.54398 Transcript_41367/m.54398 type:complete len:130 (-) Transcript_41367:1714-2103(-)